MTPSHGVHSAVHAEGLGKRYRQYRDESMLLKRLIRPFAARRHHELWALRDVDLEVASGETLGIIGRNGSGKTTLLRLLSGVTAPSTGVLRVVGRRAPLIGIGVGFNHELTGRENVRVNGRLLGMTAREVQDRFDEIVAFAELEDFVDVPVKFYSSGMFLRLAFSVAIHLDPQVLLVDEILAVGDVAFQAKCFERMAALQDRGATIVLVTHNLQVLQRLAARTVVLDAGQLVFDGGTEDGIRRYHEVMQRPRPASPVTPLRAGGPTSSGGPTARATLSLIDAAGDATVQVAAHQPMRVVMDVEFEEFVDDPVVALTVERPGLGLLFVAATAPGGYRGRHGPGSPLQAEFTLDEVPLLPGSFVLGGSVHAPRSDEPIALAPRVTFHVTSDRTGSGSVDFAPRVTIAGRPVPMRDIGRLRDPRVDGSGGA